jgi:hypothetical protein
MHAARHLGFRASSLAAALRQALQLLAGAAATVRAFCVVASCPLAPCFGALASLVLMFSAMPFLID